jgi:hypothetical protein
MCAGLDVVGFDECPNGMVKCGMHVVNEVSEHRPDHGVHRWDVLPFEGLPPL